MKLRSLRSYKYEFENIDQCDNAQNTKRNKIVRNPMGSICFDNAISMLILNKH